MKKYLVPVVALALVTVPAWAGPSHPVTAKLIPAYSILLPGVEIDGISPTKHLPRTAHPRPVHRTKSVKH
ncbi:hypothetical protein [Hymenobacter sp. GOD-10R]|uniref:hypothetical protein n=1 Tax=Hymenobacter sp. GOD-10R TaxID=3093922 RepID=UPI002D796A88|nr:hypothetical protein [Hymenobacter sp. GOD-10R]WRQ27021.1 hypothetical protein SD425_18270 [Hymenobacter sp. GOD-10R]